MTALLVLVVVQPDATASPANKTALGRAALHRCVLCPRSSAAMAISARATVILQRKIWILNGWAGRLGVAGTALRIVVFKVSMNVTGLVPTVTAGIGLGVMVESPGRPETAKFTAFPKPFTSVGPTVTLIVTDCPEVTLVGFAAMVAVKSSTVKVTCCVLAPPPGVGFVTATFGVPPVAMSEAGTATTICVGEIVAGVRAALLPRATVVPVTKPTPVIVIVNPAPPGACVGDTDVIVGTGLLTVKDSAFEGPVVGSRLITVTLTVALAAVAAAGICTTICPAVIDVGTKPVVEPKVHSCASPEAVAIDR